MSESQVRPSTSDRFRARLAAMTPAEKTAALERLMLFIEPTDDEIADGVDAMTVEEIDADLRADGIDPQTWADEVRRKIAASKETT